MRTFDWKNWSDWIPLEDIQTIDFTSLPSKPGTYVIATDGPLTRAIDVDPNGISSIGESDDLRTRLQKFASCASISGKEGHIAGWRYAFFQFQRYFPLSTLRVRWRVSLTKEIANELEGEMLLIYLSNHLELPPLNYKFNWSPFKKEGWSLFDVMIGAKQPPDEVTGLVVGEPK
jgi:hypothetical protein